MKLFVKENPSFDDTELIVKSYFNNKDDAFGKRYGKTFSQKRLKDMGYELREMTYAEFQEYESEQNLAIVKSEMIAVESNAEQRFESVKFCLECEALEMISNPLVLQMGVKNVVYLKEGDMFKEYQGRGEGTAYFSEKGDRKTYLIAFHYGHDKPSNAPDVNDKTVLAKKVIFTAEQIRIH